MSAQTVIGGNLQAIADSADRLTKSAEMASQTGLNTKSAATDAEGAINELMDSLVTRFTSMGDELKADIAASHEQLDSADWRGQSRDNAVAIKKELLSQVNKLVEEATTNLGAEREAFSARATALVEGIGDGFKQVMNQVDVEYNALATASRKTSDNLLAADSTIQM